MYPPQSRHDYHLPPPRLDSTPPSSSSSASSSSVSISPPLSRHPNPSPPSDSPPSPSSSYSNHHHHAYRPHTASRSDLMGRPIHFMTGQFAGKTIRAQLNEIQKADLGRKYARVDRRPLDPPPVVQLRLFQVYQAGTDQETEQEIPNYDEVEVLGLMCTVDLFPVDSPDQAPRSRHHYDYGPNGAPYPRSGPPSRPQDTRTYPYSYMSQPQPQSQASSTMPPILPLHVPNGSPTRRSPGSTSVSSYSSSSTPPSSNSSSDVIHRIGTQVLTEESKLTNALVGATFVQPCCVDYQGRKALLFVFAVSSPPPSFLAI
ncbi:hypothetical protein AX16_010529 [Volvariella volvacea WC 439]|nr:hypothetical protein AX16_010529 [Volvariella volvacea WC 439]